MARVGAFRWIGLLDPTRREVLEEVEQFPFSDFAFEGALTTHQRPKIEQDVDVGDRIAHDVRAIEHSVFDDDVPAVPRELYAVKREVIEFQRAVAPMLEPLTELASGSVTQVDSGSQFDFSNIRDHLLRVLDQVETLDRILDAGLRANLALITVKQNENMRKISARAGMASVLRNRWL